MDYNTGFQYSVTGTNIKHSGASISPGAVIGNGNTMNGVTNMDWFGYKQAQLVVANTWRRFAFTETYQGAGLSNHTVIERTTEVQASQSPSIFTQ